MPYAYGADSTRGYDDVAFVGQKVFLSYTNPVNPGDAVVQQLTNGTAPFGSLQTTDVLRFGDTGTNLAHGRDQPAAPRDGPGLAEVDARRLADPHRRGGQGVHHHQPIPAPRSRAPSFVTLPAGSTSPDDVIMPTAASGTFYVSNQNDNNILAVKVDGLNTKDLYASVGSVRGSDRPGDRHGDTDHHRAERRARAAVHACRAGRL